MSQNKNNSVFKLKGSLFTLTVLQLLQVDVEKFKTQLSETISQTPNFFKNAPIILDLKEIEGISINLKDFIDVLLQLELILVGVRSGDAKHLQNAKDLKLAILHGTMLENVPESKPTAKAPKKTEEAGPVLLPTKIVTQPVRSGQQIYAPGSDLIIISSVGAGAEILADGSIHVYGPLRGRALAGVRGDTSARIFCKSLEAELISIAGHYLVNDNYAEVKHDVDAQIFLENDQLNISLL